MHFQLVINYKLITFIVFIKLLVMKVFFPKGHNKKTLEQANELLETLYAGRCDFETGVAAMNTLIGEAELQVTCDEWKKNESNPYIFPDESAYTKDLKKALVDIRSQVRTLFINKYALVTARDVVNLLIKTYIKHLRDVNKREDLGMNEVINHNFIAVVTTALQLLSAEHLMEITVNTFPCNQLLSASRGCVGYVITNKLKDDCANYGV